MEASLFQRFCDIAYDRAGIALKPGKESLVSARVAKRLRALRLNHPCDYLALLESDPTGTELVEFLDVITTNYTRFYREPDHFLILERAIRRWVAAGRDRLRIWCAASSSGEEPYTLAITVLEALEGADVDARILATDLSTRMLGLAARGEYSAETIEPVGAERRERWFVPVGGHGEGRYRVRPELRDLIVFKRLNLAAPPFPMRGPLDAIFCRNVMIYFDREVRQRLVAEMDHLLAPDGLLFIGHTETLTGIRSGVVALKPSVYRPAGAGYGATALLGEEGRR